MCCPVQVFQRALYLRRCQRRKGLSMFELGLEAPFKTICYADIVIINIGESSHSESK